MSGKREAALTALYTLLQGIPGIMTFSRRLLHWSQTEPEFQPAIFVTAGDQVPDQKGSGLPPIWRWNVKVYVYVYDADQNGTPAIALNEILDAIDTILKPSKPTDKQTLSGTCVHCWIAGAVETDEGLLGDQAVAIVPLEILFA